ncbi:hypothetical protein D3OALGA1CA_1694 [Olavius algarvensis associated proteobacterium Delta 3]|nr:hypothetical protein D3OALGA1CA_1694 [Olavius algarvensis associated proteobacterium Delta 3]CAB5112571.1 hypothetical protein D3OALGB2SA_2493 [Olavius algarvensis associated proteobacterium Delta 3]
MKSLNSIIVLLIISFSYIATVNPASALTYSDIEVTCPLDGTTFNVKMAMSGTRLGMRLDRKPLGPIAAPWPVPVCPTDHFVLYKQAFDQNEINDLNKLIGSPEYRNQVEKNSSYYLLAKIYEFQGKPSHEIAHTYLKASWQVERDQPETYAKYASLSLEHFEKFLSEDNLRDPKTLSVEVLCAELERRLALFDSARKRLTRLKDQFELDKSMYEKLIDLEMELINAGDTAPHEMPRFPEAEAAHRFLKSAANMYDQGLLDRAIETYGRAIQLVPDFTDAYMGRFLVYYDMGLGREAMDDLNIVIRLEPHNAMALYDRGLLNFEIGRFGNAADDFEQSFMADPTSLLCAVFLYLSRERSGRNGKPELERNVSKFDLSQWPGPVASLYLGNATAQQVLTAANHPVKRKQRELECEAFFYVGQYFLLEGKTKSAADFFRKAVASNIHHFVEHRIAESELGRLP